MAKKDVYAWQITDSPGLFQMVHKSELRIDHNYQRDNVSEKRVNRVASRFSWVKFGALAVGRRPDGSLWVLDGQHRKLGADKRADIGTLPCMIFQVDGLANEAIAFLGINTDRGAVKMLDKWRTLIVSQDEITIKVNSMIEASGYRAAGGGSDFTVKCVATISKNMRTSEPACRLTWDICCQLFRPKPVTDYVFDGIFNCERHLMRRGLGSLRESHNWQAILDAGFAQISKEIRECKVFYGKRPGSAAQAIVRILNKRRRSRRIADVVIGEGE